MLLQFLFPEKSGRKRISNRLPFGASDAPQYNEMIGKISTNGTITKKLMQRQRQIYKTLRVISAIDALVNRFFLHTQGEEEFEPTDHFGN